MTAWLMQHKLVTAIGALYLSTYLGLALCMLGASDEHQEPL